MTPLIRKEIRLLLPFLGIALFLAAVPSWVISEESYVAPINPVIYWAFGFGVMLLGLAPFGQEFSLGTFPSLLAQPLQRNRIWLTKLLLISAAALFALLVFVFSIHLRLDSILSAVTQQIQDLELSANHFNNINLPWYLNFQKSLIADLHSFVFWRVGFILVLVGLAGGLWTSLLFRQTGAALWFTILVPGAIFVCVDWFMPENSAHNFVAFVTLGIYSVAGFVWARRMFMEAQDAQWLGGTISLSGLGSSRVEVDSARARSWGPLRALLRKELQSQQINFLIAFGLLVLHLCTLASRWFHTGPKNSQLRFVLEAIPYLWLLLPWLLGSVAVAEERKLGTMESQMCLPASRRLQFIVKFCVAMVLGVVLGAAVPWLIERAALRFHIPSSVISASDTVPSGVDVLVILSIIAAAIAFLSFFASTLTRNTLQALGVSIVVTGLCFALFEWTGWQSFQNWSFIPWKGPLIFFIGIPILAVAVLWRSFAQFNLLSVTWKAALRSFTIIGCSLLFAAGATTFLYQRTWQFVMSLEPPHAPPVLNGPLQPKLRFTYDRIFALLPDGRLWTGARYTNAWLGDFYDSSRVADQNKPKKMFVPFPETGRFLGGSNWTDIAGDWNGLTAVQSDGSLWSIFQSQEPTRVGTDSNWQSVAAAWNFFVALKQDGTLWSWWGYSVRPGANVDKDTNNPVRVGSDSDWVRIFASGGSAFGIKRDGSVWKWGPDWTGSIARGSVPPAKSGLSGTNFVSIQELRATDLALGSDGVLQIEGQLADNVLGILEQPGADSDRVRRIHDADKTTFADIQGTYDLVGLTRTGTILQNNIDRPINAWGHPVWRPSKHNDWIAVDSGRSVVFAGLAADGTLSFWRYPTSLPSHRGAFLGPTRKPVWTVNILASAK